MYFQLRCRVDVVGVSVDKSCVDVVGVSIDKSCDGDF